MAVQKWSGGGNLRVPTARVGREHKRGTSPLIRGARGLSPNEVLCV